MNALSYEAHISSKCYLCLWTKTWKYERNRVKHSRDIEKNDQNSAKIQHNSLMNLQNLGRRNLKSLQKSFAAVENLKNRRMAFLWSLQQIPHG